MQSIKRAKLVPYTPEQMYDLVNDVTHYQEFVPWCQHSAILSTTDNIVEGQLTFAKGGLVKSFTTRNTLHPKKLIDICLIDGPFKHLEGFWRFEPRGNDKTLVMLDLEFEFSVSVVAILFAPIFNQVATTLVDVFSDRADALYG